MTDYDPNVDYAFEVDYDTDNRFETEQVLYDLVAALKKYPQQFDQRQQYHADMCPSCIAGFAAAWYFTDGHTPQGIARQRLICDSYFLEARAAEVLALQYSARHRLFSAEIRILSGYLCRPTVDDMVRILEYRIESGRWHWESLPRIGAGPIPR